MLVVIGGACLTGIDQKLGDGVLARPGQARDRANRLTFTEKVQDARAIFRTELVQSSIQYDQYA